MARILIDGRFVGVGESVSRYTLEVMKGLLELDKDNEYTLLTRPQGIKEIERYIGKLASKSEIRNPRSETNSKSENSKLPTTNLKLKVLDIPHYSKSEQIELLKYLNKEKFDLVHFAQFNHPIFYKGKFVVTIHDLTMIGHLHRQNPIKRIAFGKVMKSAVKNSAKIMTVSQFSKDDILSYYKVPSEKIIVTYNGIDHLSYSERVKNEKSKIEEFKKKYGIAGDYLLYTGAWKKHKNLIRLLKAFEEYRLQNTENSVQLVLVGKVDTKEPEVLELINKINSKLVVSSQSEANHQLPTTNYQPIVTTGFVEEKELPIAYAGARAYIIPSLSEGFGLPPLEAMACGTPVISSKESCMPEILGDAPIYFDPYSIDDIAEKMKEVCDADDEVTKKMLESGLRQAKKYDWKKTAEQTLKVYKEVLKQS